MESHTSSNSLHPSRRNVLYERPLQPIIFMFMCFKLPFENSEITLPIFELLVVKIQYLEQINLEINTHLTYRIS